MNGHNEQSNDESWRKTSKQDETQLDAVHGCENGRLPHVLEMLELNLTAMLDMISMQRGRGQRTSPEFFVEK